MPFFKLWCICISHVDWKSSRVKKQKIGLFVIVFLVTIVVRENVFSLLIYCNKIWPKSYSNKGRNVHAIVVQAFFSFLFENVGLSGLKDGNRQHGRISSARKKFGKKNNFYAFIYSCLRHFGHQCKMPDRPFHNFGVSKLVARGS